MRCGAKEILTMRSASRLALVVVGGSIVFGAASASAAEVAEVPSVPISHRIGVPGQIVIGGQGSLGIDSYESENGAQSHITAMGIAATTDVFVVRGLSLGLGTGLNVSHATFEGGGGSGVPLQTRTAWGFAPSLRVGAYFPVGDHFGLWPLVSVGGEWGWWSASMTGPLGSAEDDGSWRALTIAGELGAIVPLSDGLFLRIAPRIERRASEVDGEAMGRNVSARIALGLGGYF
jgi:hypothetical protein